MGFTVNDLRPAKITPITPSVKDTCCKLFEIASDEGAAEVTKVAFPAQGTILRISAYPSTAGGAGDSVTINIEKDGSVISTGTVNLETGGAAGGVVAMSNLPNLQSFPPGGDIYIKTTSTVSSGGPWIFLIDFIQ